MKRKEGCILRSIGGMDMIVPVSGDKVIPDSIFTLYGAGAFLWEQLKKECTQEELLEVVCKEYDIDKETAQKDIAEFLMEALAAGIVEN